MESERLLAQALRAQAAGAHGPPSTPVTAQLRARPARQLAAGWVLLIALLLGLLGGVVAGIVSIL